MDKLSTGINWYKTNKYQLVSTDNRIFENDALFEMYGDLVNQKFRSWYMKMFYAIGKDEVMRLASIARSEGKDKQKLFSHLLKKACNG